MRTIRLVGSAFILATLSYMPLSASDEKKVTNSIGMVLAHIPAGDFMMGSDKDDADRLDDEGPRHKVKITKPFYLGVHEVTQKQFHAVMGKNPSFFCKGGTGEKDVAGLDTSDFPVERVTWDEAVEFCRKLSEKESKFSRKYRLPTEAEWEYACRGGVTPYKKHHTGDTLTKDDANANFASLFLERTVKVGSYKPNAFGLYDMHGNVREWCQDWYGNDYYVSSPDSDPPGPAKGTYMSRVHRGGAWVSAREDCRSASRRGGAPDDGLQVDGFRVAMVLSK